MCDNIDVTSLILNLNFFFRRQQYFSLKFSSCLNLWNKKSYHSFSGTKGDQQRNDENLEQRHGARGNWKWKNEKYNKGFNISYLNNIYQLLHWPLISSIKNICLVFSVLEYPKKSGFTQFSELCTLLAKARRRSKHVSLSLILQARPSSLTSFAQICNGHICHDYHDYS